MKNAVRFVYWMANQTLPETMPGTTPPEAAAQIDPALTLKKRLDAGQPVGWEEARPLLARSPLVAALMAPIDESPPYLLNRLAQLAEIPYSGRLTQTRRWAQALHDQAFFGQGFSLNGKADGLLACYNAMITTVLIQLGHPALASVQAGVAWIMQYQHTSRGQACAWPGKGIQKYGGCMKATPCYIGVAKSMVALSAYQSAYPQHPIPGLADKCAEGLDYLLLHQVYLRQPDEKPITTDITKLAYPFTYKTNMLEILRLLGQNHRGSDPRCATAKAYLRGKKNKHGHWQAHRVAWPKHWVPFDHPKTPGWWISHEIEKALAAE